MTTRIRVKGEDWDVPRGFGRNYLSVLKDPAGLDVLSDLLLLVGFKVDEKLINAWSLRRRVDAEVWAVNESLRASDNIVRRCPKPDFLPDPWKGEGGKETVLGWTPEDSSVVHIEVGKQTDKDHLATCEYKSGNTTLLTECWGWTAHDAVAGALTRMAKFIRSNGRMDKPKKRRRKK